MASGFSAIPLHRISKSAYSLREKTLILNVHDALIHQQPTNNVRNIITICANMIGVGQATIYRFLKERKCKNLSEPKPLPGKKPMDIDDDTKYAIRRTVHAFYFAKEIPTLDKIL